MSAARRLRRRNRIVHDPLVRARIAVAMARGLTLREAADRHSVPERSARNWTHAHHWAKWIELAQDAIARNPLQRDDAIAHFLLEELHRGNVGARTVFDAAYVADMKAQALAQAAHLGSLWDDAPAEAVVCWLGRRSMELLGSASPPTEIGPAADWWAGMLLRALSAYECARTYRTPGTPPPEWATPTSRPPDLDPTERLEVPS